MVKLFSPFLNHFLPMHGCFTNYTLKEFLNTIICSSIWDLLIPCRSRDGVDTTSLILLYYILYLFYYYSLVKYYLHMKEYV